MLHGLTGSRKSNESDFVVGSGSKYHYNNLWFASKGYMVLSFTARGWHIFNTSNTSETISRSPCVNFTPQSVDGNPASMYPGPDAACYIQISHLKYDVADTQHLIGRLVDGTLTNADGVEAAPRKVGVTGISLGAGQTWLLTRKNEWKSPKGTLIRIAGAAPIIGWTDIVDALAPNGRRRDTETSLSLAAREAEMAGVKNDYVDVFYTGVSSFSTSFGNTTSYLSEWKQEFDAGEPYTGDPVIADAIHKLLKNRSAWYVKKTTDFDTPIFAVQGMTDGIFWAGQSLRMYNRLNAEREAAGKARYPMRLYLGDWGHSPSQNKQAEFQYFARLLNNWFRYHIKGNDIRKPLNTIEARMTICNGSDGALGPLYRNGNWSLLSGGGLATPVDTSGTPTIHTPADDPHDDTLIPADGGRPNPAPGGTKGINGVDDDSCRATDTDTDTDNAQWTSDPIAGDPVQLLGMPEVTVTVDPQYNEMYVAGRLWDVDYGADVGPDDDTQTLVTRGVYRIEGADEG
ncbi:MAG TPA: CocE/NonD family hydrolase, partial [Actinomycetota bacterium]|nr:CocE/NonD family hydrolase [Actinomycetota bacterium]